MRKPVLTAAGLLLGLLFVTVPASSQQVPNPMSNDAANAKLPAARAALNASARVPDNATLAAAATSLYPAGVWRDDYAAGTGAPPLFFMPLVGSCAATPPLASDGGFCINSSAGNSWRAVHPAGPLDARQWGAKGDGATNNTPIFTSINTTAQSLGGRVIALASGTWNMSTDLTLGAANQIMLMPGANLAGAGKLYGSLLATGNTLANLPSRLSAWGHLSMTASNTKGRSGFLGHMSNDLPPATVALPGGVNGYARVDTNGNQAFGSYGVAELYATGGGSVIANEFTARNFSGDPPDVMLPTNTAIGTTTAAVKGFNLTCGTEGINGKKDCSIGTHIGNETSDFTDPLFNTAEYIHLFRQFGIFIEAQPTGVQIPLVIKANPGSVHMHLQTIGTIVPDNGVIEYFDGANNGRFSLRQSGDIHSWGHMYFQTPTRPTVTACGTSPGVNSSTDTAGAIAVGTGTVTSCTVQFARAFDQVPVCTLGRYQPTPDIWIMPTTSAAQLVVGSATGASMASGLFTYHCFGQAALGTTRATANQTQEGADPDREAYLVCEGQHEMVAVDGKWAKLATYKPGFEYCADLGVAVRARFARRP